MCKLIQLFLTLLVIFLIPGCFVGTHSFNNGKLLNPGERLITSGYGWKYSARYIKQYKDVIDIKDSSRSYFDSTRFGWFNFSLDYRVGVLRKYPFGKGLETGFHVENAYRGDQYVDFDGQKSTDPEFFGPPLLEIETRFGLVDINLRKCIYHHNVNWGWAIGQWVDNGWFWGYTAGVEFEKAIVYGSLRYQITATDKINENVDLYDDYFKKHDRTHTVRLMCGTSLKLPLNESFVPEYITPEFSIVFPNFNRVQPVGFGLSIGIGWIPGF